MICSAIRRETFNCAHRLYRKDWSDEKNNEIFGLCNNPNFHGHNYVLEVKVTGEVNQETGYLIDLKILKNIIKSEVTDYLDHRNLNLDIPEFFDLIPTAENISYVIWNKLRVALDNRFDLSVKLFETEKNIVEYNGK
jgi:6-pyruvoyltetrahydropterin/6-carboxytetrahydropterin synthase